jgi:TldD protein
VGSEVVALIVHESCGHPSEADRILGREAAQAGKSFIKPSMLGQRIGNEYATVIDDPTIPGSYGFYLYDDEGVAARARYLYKEGAINEFLHNRATAKTFGVESNAAARTMDYASEPIVRMANTYLKPGDHRFEELLEDIKLGVYMKSYMEWNIDDERWSQRYVGLEAYIIENGELTKPVRNPVLEITTKAFYSNIDAVGKELRFYAGTCGKGEPSQGVPVWFGGPDVRLRSARLGVVA